MITGLGIWALAVYYPQVVGTGFLASYRDKGPEIYISPDSAPPDQQPVESADNYWHPGDLSEMGKPSSKGSAMC